MTALNEFRKAGFPLTYVSEGNQSHSTPNLPDKSRLSLFSPSYIQTFFPYYKNDGKKKIKKNTTVIIKK